MPLPIVAWWAGLSLLAKAAINIGISLGLGLLARALAPKPKDGEFLTGTDLGPQVGADVPRQIIIGTTGVFGQLVHHNSWGDSNENHQQVFALSDWFSHSLLGVIMDAEVKTLSIQSQSGALTVYTVDGVSSDELTIRFYDGTQTTADSELVNNSNPVGKWDSNSKLINITYVALIWKYNKDSELFQGGLPKVKFILKGAKLYDWRLDDTAGGSGSHRWDDPLTWEYSENPVVAMYNYQRGFYANSKILVGMGVPSYKFILGTYTTAADACDDPVALGAGGTEARYRIAINVAADRDIKHADVLDVLRSTFAGYLYDYAGQYYADVGVAKTVAATITDNDIPTSTPILWSAKRTSTELINTIMGQFLDVDNLYEASSYTAQISTSGITEDGEELVNTHDLLSVPSQFQAERIARIRLREARLQANGKIFLTFKYLFLQAGDWITWNSAGYAESRTYRIVNKQIDWDSSLINIELEEISSTVYLWDSVDEGPIVQPPIFLQPGGQLSTVLNFNVQAGTVEEDALTMPSLEFTWTPPNDGTIVAVIIEVEQIGGPFSYHTVQNVEGGSHSVYPVAPGSSYQARATIQTIPARTTTWTSYVPLTTGNWEIFQDALDAELQAKVQQIVDNFPTQLQTLRDDLDTLASVVNNETTGAQGQFAYANKGIGIRYNDSVAGIEEVRVVAAGNQSAMAQFLLNLFAVDEDTGAASHVSFRLAAVTAPDEAISAAILQLRAGNEIEDEFAEAAIEIAAYFDGTLETYYSKVTLRGDRVDFIVDGQTLPAYLLAIADTPYDTPVVAGTPNTVTPDLTARRLVYKTVMTDDATLQFPLGAQAGFGWEHIFEQDGSGGHALSVASEYKSAAPTISATANSITWCEGIIVSTGAQDVALFYDKVAGSLSGALPEAGEIIYSVPGTYTFTIPLHNTIVFEAWGGGGGGGAGGVNSYNNGGTGGSSYWNPGTGEVRARGGTGGVGNKQPGSPAGGTGGVASGGDVNTNGENGSAGTDTNDPTLGFAIGGGGGDAPDGLTISGGLGGAQQGPFSDAHLGKPGSSPGGGGGGGVATGPGGGGGGGSGAYVRESYTTPTLTVGDQFSVIVGAGGTKGTGYADGGIGGHGRIRISWS